MKLYNIRYYRPEDRPRLIQFLDKYWRKNHIISTSDILFDFQHRVEDRYTFVVAENKETEEFDGVYGYILTHKYDTSHAIPNVAWGAIWKVRSDVKSCEIGSLGLGLLKFIIKNENILTFASSGISDMHKQIAQGLGFLMGEMTHYYIANTDIDDYHIAFEPHKQQYLSDNDAKLKWVGWSDSQAQTLVNTINPYKNYCYFIHRYKEHPIYRYKMLGFFYQGNLQLLFVVRKQKMGNVCCLRIVDLIGSDKHTANLGYEMQKILAEANAEYIDCWNYGLASSFFDALGFYPVSGSTIIPDYFAPFERKNTIIEVDSMNPIPFIVFKGDGDQDRPNSEITKEW